MALSVVHDMQGARFQVSGLPAGRVAVLFTADWCGYCHRFLPHFKRFWEGVVVDISDEDLAVWDELRIHVVPTVIVFEDGIPGRRWSGVLGSSAAEEIAAALETG